MRIGLSGRGKIDRESVKSDLYTQELVKVCGGMRMWLLQSYGESLMPITFILSLSKISLGQTNS